MNAEFKRMMELAGLAEISINQPNLLNQIKTLKNQIDSWDDPNVAYLQAVRCARLVLPIFEKEFPNDKRIRNVIEASETYLANPTEVNQKILTRIHNLATDTIDEMDMSLVLRDDYYDSVYTAALTAVGAATAILNDAVIFAQNAAYAATIAAGGGSNNLNELDEIKVNPPTQYYAIFNYTYNNDNVYYLTTLSKATMIEKLNKAYKEFAIGNPPYTIEDMEESHYDSYINDDWAIVTKNASRFKETFDGFSQYGTLKPYKG